MRLATLTALALALSALLPAGAQAADPGDDLSAGYKSQQNRIAASKARSKAQQDKLAAAAPEPPTKVKYGSISILGTAKFIKATKDALDLVARAGYISQVEDYVKLIYEPSDDLDSGMYAYQKSFRVGAPTWKNGPVWYGSTIVHDSMHSKLYWDAWDAGGHNVVPSASVYTGANAEKKCLTLQSEVLRRLGADANTLEYVRKLGENPAYQDVIVRNW
ncbi:MAG: hypothetical protein ACHQ49_05885 [Elusimicrobiota bacterium]